MEQDLVVYYLLDYLEVDLLAVCYQCLLYLHHNFLLLNHQADHILVIVFLPFHHQLISFAQNLSQAAGGMSSPLSLLLLTPGHYSRRFHVLQKFLFLQSQAWLTTSTATPISVSP